jgi:peptide methionine sulfoxide reductase MsrB
LANRSLTEHDCHPRTISRRQAGTLRNINSGEILRQRATHYVCGETAAVAGSRKVHAASSNNLRSEVNHMTRSENRCAQCGGKFGLVSYQNRGLRFCRKDCRDRHTAKAARDHVLVRKWFGCFAAATK